MKPTCYQLLYDVEMYATNYLTTELAYSKLKYILFNRVVMTDRLKIVRIRAQNVPVHGHKRLDDDASLVSLSLQESDGVACSMRRGTILLKHKNRLRTTCACVTVASKQESCRYSMSSSL